MKDWKEIIYPKFFVSLSKELSLLRSKLSEDVYKEGTSKYRGSQEEKISQLGMLAELIAQNYLTEQDKSYQSAPLVDLSPVVGCDIEMEEYKIDVKGVKKEDNKLRVNYEAHTNLEKDISHYLFVQVISSSEARYKWFSVQEVSRWKVIQSTYSKCFATDI